MMGQHQQCVVGNNQPVYRDQPIHVQRPLLHSQLSGFLICPPPKAVTFSLFWLSVRVNFTTTTQYSKHCPFAAFN